MNKDRGYFCRSYTIYTDRCLWESTAGISPLASYLPVCVSPSQSPNEDSRRTLQVYPTLEDTVTSLALMCLGVGVVALEVLDRFETLGVFNLERHSHCLTMFSRQAWP